MDAHSCALGYLLPLTTSLKDEVWSGKELLVYVVLVSGRGRDRGSQPHVEQYVSFADFKSSRLSLVQAPNAAVQLMGCKRRSSGHVVLTAVFLLCTVDSFDLNSLVASSGNGHLEYVHGPCAL